MSDREDLSELAQSLIERARAAGADVAEACAQTSSHLSTKVRMREAELVEEADSRSIGLRVMIGKQVAVTYSSDFSKLGQQRLIEDAIELAKLSQPDEFAGPPDASLLSTPEQWAELDTFDAKVDEIEAKTALDWSLRGEGAAFNEDSRITNSEGATFGRAIGSSVVCTSGGFKGSHRGSYTSIVVSPVADDEDGKKRSGYHWSATRHFEELESAEAVGIEAAKRTVAQLGATKIDTQEIPVIFDKDAARSILGLLAGCIMGGAIWRKSSYLVSRLDTQVASRSVNIIDDPLIPRAPGSRAFDGEGLLSRKNTVIEAGVLKTYLLDSYSGRKLELPSTASAARGSSGGVSASTSNFILQPGTTEPEDIVAQTQKGLYVTRMMGFGFNAVTGDFSRGAGGFLVENGELTQPVSEVTISLNLDDLLKRIDVVGNDLDMRTATASPTFRVSSMTVAGR